MIGSSKPPLWNWSWGSCLAAKTGLPQPQFFAPLWEGAGARTTDIAGCRTGTLTGAVWSGSRGGTAVAHLAITDRVNFGDATRILPVKNCTILLGYQKRDTTLRASSALGVTSNPANGACGVHLPYNDGVAYWDFKTTTVGDGRLTASGLTYGNDFWAFTIGTRGQEIWQNGVLRASNATNVTRTASSNDWQLGTHNTIDSDLANYWMVAVFHQQLPQDQIKLISAMPFIYHCRASQTALLTLQAGHPAMRRWAGIKHMPSGVFQAGRGW